MKYKVIILDKRFYKWEVHASSQEEAKYLAKNFFALVNEREEKFIGNKMMMWSFIEKDW